MGHDKRIEKQPSRFSSPAYGRIVLFIALLISVVGAASCSKSYNRNMALPDDPAAISTLGWAVVKTTYAKLKPIADSKAPDSGIVRGGSVFRCTARSIDPEGLESGGLWYHYEREPLQGWIHQDELMIFDTEEQAKRSARGFGQAP